ncbi:MAG: cyclic nucleotide-binding domain-containing protein [Rhodocyclales bacterium]|nr:cyclic nucleotide-binding domain-containing protein [Rhodocyclales bacterium]
MSEPSISTEVLRQLEPLGALSPDSLREISRMCYVEKVSRNLDPFRLQGLQGQSVYLVKGELKLDYPDSSSEILVGGTEAAVRSLVKRKPAFSGAKAITDVELIRIDEEVLDIMLTWDQLAAPQAEAHARKPPDAMDLTDWRTMTGMFAAENLTRGIFASLPPANIEALLMRFQRIKVPRGEAIIREGGEGDFYYVIESGRCTVSRQVGGASYELAELKGGDAFGEEALVANAKRNANVTMKTDGVLLRLAKADFIELLKEPLMHRISRQEAEAKVASGAIWLDVRFAAEYNAEKLPGAINIPLNEIRNLFGSLDRQKEYIVYCQSGRRSSAAAFLLSQRGYKAYLLEGGLRGNAA